MRLLYNESDTKDSSKEVSNVLDLLRREKINVIPAEIRNQINMDDKLALKKAFKDQMKSDQPDVKNFSEVYDYVYDNEHKSPEVLRVYFENECIRTLFQQFKQTEKEKF